MISVKVIIAHSFNRFDDLSILTNAEVCILLLTIPGLNSRDAAFYPLTELKS